MKSKRKPFEGCTPLTSSIRCSQRSFRAFTLIEVIAVLVLLAVVMVVILGRVPRSNASLTAEADQLAFHLRYTQLRAQSDIYQWSLRFINGRTYQLGPITGAGFTPALIPGTGVAVRSISPGITALSSSDITFDTWGRPPSAAAITLSDGARTIPVSAHAKTGFIP